MKSRGTHTAVRFIFLTGFKFQPDGDTPRCCVPPSQRKIQPQTRALCVGRIYSCRAMHFQVLQRWQGYTDCSVIGMAPYSHLPEFPREIVSMNLVCKLLKKVELEEVVFELCQQKRMRMSARTWLNVGLEGFLLSADQLSSWNFEGITVMITAEYDAVKLEFSVNVLCYRKRA